MVNGKENKKILLIVGIVLSVAVVFSLSVLFTSKGSYAKASSYTSNREKFQDFVVSTALSYYYNQDYSEYESDSMEKAQESPYKTSSYLWADHQVSPEDVSRSNNYTTNCSGFVMNVYLYSLGYDMSEYYQYNTSSYLENNTWKKIYDSVENYQNGYWIYGKGFTTPFLSKVAKNVSATGDSVGVEYINNDNSNKSSVVYYYQTNLDDDNNYTETEEEQEQIKENILNTLQPGDILVYRKKDKSSGTETGHAMLYVGNAINSSEHGFIHSTGNKIDLNTDPITIGEDVYSVRYDSWENLFTNRIFIDSKTYASVSFTIIRPINTYCDGDDCTIDSETAISYNYQNDFETSLSNTITRDELSRLRIEQYQTSEVSGDTLDSVMNIYSSVNNGNKIRYNLILTNKSAFSYCEAGNPEYRNEEDCINKNYIWESTDNEEITYTDLVILGKIPDGTTYVSCSNDCQYDSNTKEVTWYVDSIKPNDVNNYTYTVIVNTDDDIINEGMVIKTSSDNKLQLGSLTTHINSTINDTISINTIKDTIDEFEKKVENGEISYSEELDNDDNYKIDLSSSTTGNMSQLDFVKSIYYNSYKIDLSSISYDNIISALFNNYSGEGYNVYTKKNSDEIANLTNQDEININKMLVPGLYGGQLLKGNDNGDRGRFLDTNSLGFGDIIMTIDTENSILSTYIFYGYDENNQIILVEFNQTSDGDDKVMYYSSDGTYEKSGWRIFKEMIASDLFMILRPTRLYGTTVIYNYNGGVSSNDVTTTLVNDTYQNLDIPTKEDYIFAGWFSDSEFTNEIDNNSKLISTNTHTLYAKWVSSNMQIQFSDNLDVDNEKNVIKRITLGTTFDLLKDEIITLGDLKITDYNGNTKSDDDILATGDIIEISIGDKTYKYTLSVLGDVTGDGIIKINDISKLYRYLKGRIDLDDAYVLAGDVVENDEIKINDVSKLYRYLKGRINSLS